MEFWVLWFIGIVIAIGTRLAINKLTGVYNIVREIHIVISIIILSQEVSTLKL